MSYSIKWRTTRSRTRTSLSEVDSDALGEVIVLTDAAIVLAIAYVLLILAKYLAEWLGQTGVNVITRILGGFAGGVGGSVYC